MNTILKNVISSAEQLPETDQVELAAQIDEMIIQRKIAAAQVDLKEGRVSSLDVAFARIIKNLTDKYGTSSAT